MAELTIKQKRFIKEYIKTGNATEAADRAYDAKSRGVARRIGSENLSKLDGHIRRVLERHGLTDDYLIGTVLREGLELDAEIPIRHRYLDTALKLGDKYPSEKLDVTTQGQIDIKVHEDTSMGTVLDGEVVEDITEDADEQQVTSII